FTKMTSLGSRRGASIARKTTGDSRIFGSACTVPRLKVRKSPGANSPALAASPIQKVPLPESTYKCSSELRWKCGGTFPSQLRRSEEHTSELQSRSDLV